MAVRLGWRTLHGIDPNTGQRPVVFQTWISYQNPKFISVDKEANNDVMHFVEFRKTRTFACTLHIVA